MYLPAVTQQVYLPAVTQLVYLPALARLMYLPAVALTGVPASRGTDAEGQHRVGSLAKCSRATAQLRDSAASRGPASFDVLARVQAQTLKGCPDSDWLSLG